MTEEKFGAQWRLTGAAAFATFLTSLCLTPTVSEGKWSLGILLVITNIAVVGALARKWSLPRVLIPILQLWVLFLTTVLLFAPAQTLYGIPTLGSVSHLADLTNDALAVIWNQQPPLAATDAVVFVVTGGVGLVAIAVDAIAVTWRRPIFSGLPLFVLYLVPAAVLPHGVPWPLFALAGAGWILIQLVDGRERLAHWGRVVGATGKVTTDAAALGGTGRRLGATALVAAIAIPMVVPSIGEGVFGAGGDDGRAGGDHTSGLDPNKKVITINPIVDLKRDLTQGADNKVFTYRTTDTTPQYWRIATLDQFDGFTWTLAESSASEAQQASSGLPAPPGLSDAIARTAVVSDVQITSLSSKRLPLPYPTTSVDIDGDWRWDPDTLDVFSASDGGNALGMHYVASSLDIAPTPEQLAAAPTPGSEMDYYLQVPPDIQNLLGARTAQVTIGADTKYAQAEAIQNWFRSKFKYSLTKVTGNDTTVLEDFLHDKSGYCEQFAATMALMARVSGIPSRVQVGFTPGTEQEDGTWLVTTHDAHAWPELWFEGVGWVRFEPTPGGGDGNAAPAYAPSNVTTGDPSGNTNTHGGSNTTHLRRDTAQTLKDLRDQALANINRGGISPTANQTSGPTGPDRRLFVLMVLIMGVVLAAAPFVTKRVTRMRRWQRVSNEGDAILAAWQDVLDVATDIDLAPLPTETPRDLAARLPQEGGLNDSAREDWRALSRAVERHRYANGGFAAASFSSADPGVRARQIDVWRERSKALTANLYQAVTPADRRLAVLWPASGRQQLSNGWNHLMDSVGTRWQEMTSVLFRRLRRSD